MVKVKLPFRRQRFTSLTNSQWQVIKDFVETGRKRAHCLRRILDAIFKLNRTGCQWRNLESPFPWQTVYYYFRKWKRHGTWAAILSQLVTDERVRQHRNPSPSACAVDSQSVRKGALVKLDSGIDGGKLVNGRKRHLAVDCLGLPLAIFISAANMHDGEAGVELLWQLDLASKRLELIRGDQHYGGYFKECAAIYKWEVETIQRPESRKGFIPQKGRWQVERSFAWFNFFRRLSRDYEKTADSSAAFIQISFIDIILARISN
jgi:transposase